MFVFVTAEPYFYEKLSDRYGKEELARRLLVHEYGHTIQSLILGPLYLPFVGLPSLLWAGCYRLFRIRRAYVSVYPENWAEHLGRPSLRLDRVSGGAGRVRAPGRRG